MLLALGAGAFALSRRRSEDEIVEQEAYESVAASAPEPEPAPTPAPAFEEQPAILAPEVSAFSWGKPQSPEVALDDGSDRRPGESWVDRAYRGPSPANPSVSLRNRLRRAAFFDKREREVAEGKAEPVEPEAGLPDAMVDGQATEAEREFA